MSVTPQLPTSISEVQHRTGIPAHEEMPHPAPVLEITPEELGLRRRQRLVKWSQISGLIFFVLEVAIAFRVCSPNTDSRSRHWLTGKSASR